MKSYKIILNVAGIWAKTRPEKLKQGGIFYKAYSKIASIIERRVGNVDTPETKNAVCVEPSHRKGYKEPSILHKIKLKILEGGINFGRPFRQLKGGENVCKAVAIPAVTGPVVSDPAPKTLPLPPPRHSVQVSILGADTRVGQYIALLLKQCMYLKKLRLYEAKDIQYPVSELFSVVDDLCYINTNCLVQAFSGSKYELDRCLQNSDIVLMLDSGCTRMNMSYEDRFYYQAPIVKQYTDAIATECPNAFIIVSATPVDCMVPLIAETLKETGGYDARKLLGSVAVPEMRACTLAARALSLEPSYVKVPCVGGTEGEALLPLFSKAVDLFDFTTQNTEMMVQTIRNAPSILARSGSNSCNTNELSEAHALASLVMDVARALLCMDVPRVSGFVETNWSLAIAPTRFMANSVEIANNGIVKNMGLVKMSDNEISLLCDGFKELQMKQALADHWYMRNRSKTSQLIEREEKFYFPKTYQRFLESP